MLAQLKYSSRIYLNQRIWALLGTIVLNLVFCVFGLLNSMPDAWMVVGVTLSALSFCAVLVVSIIADVEAIKSLVSPPSGYAVALTPVPARQIILGRVIPMVVFDLISYAVGIMGIVMQSLLLDGWWEMTDTSWGSDEVTNILAGVIGYCLILLVIIFACIFAKSVLYPLRGRGILGVAAAIIIMYLFSWLNLLLTPFASVTRYGAFLSVELTSGWNPGMIAYLFLLLIEAAALLIGASYLYERKVNL